MIIFSIFNVFEIDFCKASAGTCDESFGLPIFVPHFLSGNTAESRGPRFEELNWSVPQLVSQCLLIAALGLSIGAQTVCRLPAPSPLSPSLLPISNGMMVDTTLLGSQYQLD